ncbi:unnamed protein product, partial [Musa hybrid cultivar]
FGVVDDTVLPQKPFSNSLSSSCDGVRPPLSVLTPHLGRDICLRTPHSSSG